MLWPRRKSERKEDVCDRQGKITPPKTANAAGASSETNAFIPIPREGVERVIANGADRDNFRDLSVTVAESRRAGKTARNTQKTETILKTFKAENG